jgi:AraC-like DNA-binding protein
MPSLREEPSIPAVHALHLLELAHRWNVTPDAVLAGTELRERDFRDPAKRLPIRELVTLVERARELTGEPGLGLYFGLRMQVVSHGFLGFAAMTAATLGDALEIAVRFIPTLTTAFSLELEKNGEKTALVLVERADLGAARDAVLLSLLVGIWRIGCSLTGRELKGRAELAVLEPAYFGRFRAVAPNLTFGRPRNRLVFDASVLAQPVVSADPAALELAREQCERALSMLGFEGRIAGRVRAAMSNADGGFRGIDEVASSLKLSERTLKRRLKLESTTYSTILDEARLARAQTLLREERRTLEEIAEALGYSNVANLTRAFRRWTGTTPAAYRRARPS